nr:NADH dehydrogenase subunit 6 [Neandra brunnea]
MYLTIYLLITMMTLMFLFVNHPLSFGLILLIQATLIALLTGMLSFNFWFSYILFLIMVGGMLILFIYMTSVASNEKFKLSINLLITVMICLSTSPLIMLSENSLLTSSIKTNEIMEWNFKWSLNWSLEKFISWPSIPIMFLIMSYLLLVLIMVVKITDNKQGPLRQKF